MNILYIEDDPQARRLVQRYINATPHRLTAVSNLNELELNSLAADLILLDIFIDGRNVGLEFLETMRQAGIQCPVIAITALTLPHQIASYKNAGINTIIEKPFEITQLADVIAQYDLA